MSLRFLILWAGRHSPEPWESLSADCRGRIAPFLPIEERAIRVPAKSEGRVRRKAEGEALLAATPESAFRVALSEEGDLWSSERIARQGFCVVECGGADAGVVSYERLGFRVEGETATHHLLAWTAREPRGR